jgi:hypothetical protein
VKRTPLKRRTPMKRGPWRRKNVDYATRINARRKLRDKKLEALLRDGFIQPSKVWIPYEQKPKQPTVRQRRKWMKQESIRARQFLHESEHMWCELMVTCGGRVMPREIEGVTQAPFRRRSNQVHHTRGRGKWYLVVRYWKGSCRDCHRWEDTHRNEAVKLGLRERVYEKH